MKKFTITISIVLLTLLWFVWQRSTTTAVSPENGTSLLPLLLDDGQNEGFAQALEPGALSFPADFGPHEDYQTEWWYYTGNLETVDKRPFGFQLTFFRRALTAAPLAESGSTWRTNQVYLAHFALSDIANEQFYAHERFSRAAVGLAGAQAAPYRVWLENWSAEEIAPGQIHLVAQEGELMLDLILTETLPPILHGDDGLSQKGEQGGNASYYYSIVQQQAAGTIQLPGETVEVTGLAWQDHEYLTRALGQQVIGWDWFSLQFDNGTALMFFQIRRGDGSLSPMSSGSFVSATGDVTHLTAADWQLTVTDRWASPTSGGNYPAGWQVEVPKVGLSLTGRPFMANQELNVSTIYWEGAVQFDGTLAGEAVTAKGYIEMTGYGEGENGRFQQ